MKSTVKELIQAVYGSRWGEAYVEWGTFDKDGFNRKGCGRALDAAPPDDQAVFWSAGLFRPGAGRGNASVEKVMVFVLDDVGTAAKSKIDPAEVEMFMPAPTIRIESSPGNWQWQWGIAGGMDKTVYAALRASSVFASDATAPSNLIRLPMGVNGKPGVTHAVAGSAVGPVYTETEMVEACGGLTVSAASVQKTWDELLAPSAAHVEAALKAMPNDGTSPYCDTYEAWIAFGLALYGATGGEGLELWEAWCAGQGQKRDVAYVWDSFHGTGIGWVKLAWLARTMGVGFSTAHLDLTAVDDESEDEEILALQRDVANLIVREFGDKIRFNVSTGMWHHFAVTWKENPHPLGYRLAKRWADNNAAGLGKAPRAAVSKSAFYEGVEKILRSDEKVAAVKADFDRDDWLLGTPDGTVDLRTGVKRGSVAGDMISLSTSVAPAPVEDCVRWLAFVRWVCTNPRTKKVDLGMLKTLQQWLGYCLTGDVAKEMVMFFHGDGKNGKGTIIEVMQAVLGDYFHMADKELFIETKFGRHTEEIAALAGKRMVCADEVPTNARWNESLLKAVSGGGTMTTRHLYGRMFTFPLRFKVTIIGNEKPKFQGEVNDALKRRLHLVGFPNTVPDALVDDTLKVVLKAEGAGILRWLINGLQDMLAGPGGRLFIADSVMTATDTYFGENDLLGQWLDDCAEIKDGAETNASDAFRSWIEWRNSAGNHTMLDTTMNFRPAMEKRGWVWRKGMRANVIKGLALKKGTWA